VPVRSLRGNGGGVGTPCGGMAAVVDTHSPAGSVRLIQLCHTLNQLSLRGAHDTLTLADPNLTLT
jgi:hypothetical protein